MNKLYNIIVAVIFFGSLCFTQNVHAHGEDIPGPNGGYVRMPGAFHTELVKNGDQKFKVYLLDINWKDPTVVDSTIEVKLITKKNEEQQIECEAVSNHFECSLPKGEPLKTAKRISIKAKRKNISGGLANYDLPLRFFSHQ